MSTATSSPTVDGSSHKFPAFKDEAFDDFIFADPSSNEERLDPSPDGRLASGHLAIGADNSCFNGPVTTGTNTSAQSPLSASNGLVDQTNNGLQPGSFQLPLNSHQEFFSSSEYAENGYSDLSSFNSPVADNPFYLEPEFGISPSFDEEESSSPVNQGIDNFENRAAPETAPIKPGNAERNSTISSASQLLSPRLTNTPSPTSDYQNSPTQGYSTLESSRIPNRPEMDTRPRKGQYTPGLITTPASDALGVDNTARASNPTSPVVKVSRYTRGDSPSRDDEASEQSERRNRPSLSSVHLAPVGGDLEDDLDDSEGQFSTLAQMPIPSLRTDDGSWVPNEATGQGGLDPSSRGDIYGPSPDEIKELREREEKNADVEQWLSSSEAQRGRLLDPGRPRPRAKSTGDPCSAGFDDSNIPGPGAVIDEQSEVEEDDDDANSDDSEDDRPQSPPANVRVNLHDESPQEYFPPFDPSQTQDSEPLPRQFIRARPWQDAPRNPKIGDTKVQPETANAAIIRFARRAKNIETASRSATWGTRRLSESDVDSIIGPRGTFGSLQISRDRKDKTDRRGSFLDHASKLFPKRTNSNSKRKMPDSTPQHQGIESVDKANAKDGRDRGSSSPMPPQRKSSFTRTPRSPMNTSSAVLAMTGQITAVGGGGAPVRATPPPGTSPWNHIRKLSHSRSGTPTGSKNKTGGLFELMTNFGGPPVPTLASPFPHSPLSGKTANDDEDDDGDEVMGDKGIVMDFPVRSDPIVPTLEGFKTHALQLNPRLQPALAERIAQEQLRRYKKLVENKVKHAHAVSQRKCSAGQFCFTQGGSAKMLPPRVSPKDPDSTYSQYQITGAAPTENEANNLGEGAVTAALFPPGVPLPPVSRLPAKFECSLCFKEKEFHKPSDWTKHVHEDAQPFTCTFPNCSEPKSFKRKADWVRHESERHRQLEWWTCNLPDCPHTCYRKDNFVQHLVREHKMPEPKVKTTKSRANGGNKAAGKQGYLEGQSSTPSDPAVTQVWELVEECHHVTTKQPKDEPCRFCGNICTSWKKLTVHLAKHMEQIALPVLELARQRTVSLETVISPIGRGTPVRQQPQSNLISPASPYPNSNVGSATMSPYPGPLQANQNAVASVDTQPLYTSSPQDTENYGIGQVPLLSGQLRVHNALNTSSPRPGLGGTPAPSAYSGGQFTQTPSPVITRPPETYPNISREQQQFGPHVSAATYPPPFNAVRKQQGTNMPGLTQVSTAPPTYGLSIPTMPQTTGFDDSQSMYASPVDNSAYLYPQGQDVTQQPAGMSFTGATSAMGYTGMDGPIMDEPEQTTGYIHHTGGQYQFQGQ